MSPTRCGSTARPATRLGKRSQVTDSSAERPRVRQLRLVVLADDAEATTEQLVDGGAELIASPRETPWRSLNSRLQAPAGLQLTLFQQLEQPES